MGYYRISRDIVGLMVCVYIYMLFVRILFQELQMYTNLVFLFHSFLYMSENSVPLNPLVNDHYPY